MISFSDLRPKFFVLSISASVFCTSSRIVRMFAFFRQLYERTDSSSSSTLLSRFSFDTAPCACSAGASGAWSAASSRLMKMFRCSRTSFAAFDTASRGVIAPLVQTSSVSFS